ncbi:MAG: metal ABC transporter substrate-binding protein [Methyloceanibacter sp.]
MAHHTVRSILAALLLLLGYAGNAADKIETVASFSIIGDMVRQVGGDRVEVTTLVGPNGDAHVFSPTPADAAMLAKADVFFVNGLGFEGWMDRLEKSSGFQGRTVVASKGVEPLTMAEEGGHNHGAAEGNHDEHAKHENYEQSESAVADPHAWQSLANGKIYVANIRDGLIAADPDGKSVYEANAAKYLDAIEKEEDAVKAAIAKLPPARRRIITSHDAFGYFGDAYGLEIIAPEGVNTESEASAHDVAKIILQIRTEHIPAVFIENVTDRRLLDQIASETEARIGGVLYSDALSDADGPAPTYLDMFRHNIGTLTAALSS